MEFWGVEVKPGETLKCEPGEDKYIHLSQASLGETKGKGSDNVPIFVKVDDQKLILGTLSTEQCPQIPFDLVFEKEFELSHTSKSVSVYCCGYKTAAPGEQSDGDDYPESESEPEDVLVDQNANGKPIVKQNQGKQGLPKANVVKEDSSASKKAKKADAAKADKPKTEDADAAKADKPKTEDDEDEDDDDDDDEDDSEEDYEENMGLIGAVSDSDDEDEDESSEEDEETPKKATAITGKRPAESTSKTPAPAPEKKAKFTTPAGQKTGNDGKKGGHAATPHPAKQVGKTQANSDKSKQQTPKSAGSVACKSCNKTFGSENALQSHTKAKHGDGK